MSEDESGCSSRSAHSTEWAGFGARAGPALRWSRDEDRAAAMVALAGWFAEEGVKRIEVRRPTGVESGERGEGDILLARETDLPGVLSGLEIGTVLRVQRSDMRGEAAPAILALEIRASDIVPITVQ